MPELPRLQCGSALAVQQVESLVAELASAEKKLHLSRWKERMQLDVAKVRTYVKRKADEQLAFEQEPPSVEDVGGAWHPGVAVHEQARKWTEAWTVKEPPDLQCPGVRIRPLPSKAQQDPVEAAKSAPVPRCRGSHQGRSPEEPAVVQVRLEAGVFPHTCQSAVARKYANAQCTRSSTANAPAMAEYGRISSANEDGHQENHHWH